MDRIEIDDADRLWRRLHADWVRIDPSTGAARVTSAAFKDGENEVCVHLAKLAAAGQIEADFPRMGIAEVEARIPRSLNHSVDHEPEELDPSHTVIRPPAGRGSSHIARDAKAMAKAATCVKQPVLSTD